jgi:hypothetical protein
MCFYYNDECATYSEIVRRAIKDHRCISCGETIKAGDLYIYGSGVFEQSGFCVKVCSSCKKTQILIYEKELEEGCTEQSAWASLVEIKQYCIYEKFQMATYEEGQVYLGELLEIQNKEKIRIKLEMKERNKDVIHN